MFTFKTTTMVLRFIISGGIANFLVSADGSVEDMLFCIIIVFVPLLAFTLKGFEEGRRHGV